jgi:hypothetical protein
MPSAVVIPRTKVLPLPVHGWTITVHEELNHGQHIAMLARVYSETDDGRLRRDALKNSDALVIAYLVDWTLTDSSGERIDIAGLKPDDLQHVLNNLRIPVALQVKQAVQAHDAAIGVAADEQKKTDGTDVPLPQTLQSVA